MRWKLKVGSWKLEVSKQWSVISRRRSLFIVHCSLFIVSLFISSCAPRTPVSIVITQRPAVTVKPVSTIVPLATLDPFNGSPTPSLVDLSSGSQPNINSSDPFRINFGTQTAVPTLAWRPPPVPVPLSVRPEDHFWFARPIASNAVNWPHPLYRYGSTYFGFMNAHTGVDLDSPMGTPVLAANSGTVVWVGYGLLGTKPVEKDPYGNAVVIKHEFGFNGQTIYTAYAHMSETNVWLNQPVKMGEQIGLVGSTGFSTGPHLHFEIRIGENKFLKTLNPELWLAPPTGWGVLAGRVLDKNGKYIPEVPIEVIDSKRLHYPIVTYSAQFVNNDPVYKENFVLSDLPEGVYKYQLKIGGEDYAGETEIRAGQTTFVVIQESVKQIARTANPAATLGRAPSATFTSTNTPLPTNTPTPTNTPRPTNTRTPTATKNP